MAPFGPGNVEPVDVKNLPEVWQKLLSLLAERGPALHSLVSQGKLVGIEDGREAEAFAERLKTEAGPDPQRQVTLAYRLVTGNAPNPKETALGVAFLKKQPLKRFALAMFNINAFLYIN